MIDATSAGGTATPTIAGYAKSSTGRRLPEMALGASAGDLDVHPGYV
jgi:hypothetical protein